MKLWCAAIFTPWRAWPTLWAERRDGSWLYIAIALESLLMRPDASLRAVWALERRGSSAFMPLLRLASLQVIWAMLFAAALAVFFRLTRKRLALMELFGVATWAYAPKFLVTLLTAVGWAVGLWPGAAFESPAYLAASAFLILPSIAAGVRAYDSGDALPQLPRAWPLGATAVAVLLTVTAYAQKARTHPDLYMPVGRGDVVNTLPFNHGALAFPQPQPVVLYVWAKWCAVCDDVTPEWRRAKPDGLTLVDADVDSELRLQAQFQIDTLPALIALSPRGEVLAFQVGRSNLDALFDSIPR